MNSNRWINISLAIIVMTIIVTILKQLKTVFIPLTFAMYLSFIFSPINRYLTAKRVPKMITVTLIVVIIFFTFTLAGTLVYTGIATFADDWPWYKERISKFLNESAKALNIPDYALDIAEIEQHPNEYGKDGKPLETEDPDLFKKQFKHYFSEMDISMILSQISFQNLITNTMGSFGDFLFKLMMTIIFMIFIVAGRERFARRLERALTQEEQKHSSSVFREVEKNIIRYLVVKTVISLGTALAGMFFVYIFGIDFVIITGLLLFILNFIPNIGSIVASLFPIVVSIFQYGFGWQTFAIFGALTGIQTVFGNIIEPKILGDQYNLSPVVILFALIFWGWVWGGVGMVLAVPLVLTIHIIIREFDSLRVITAILSDD